MCIRDRALVSAPDFDPGRLVGPERGEYYRQLVVDPDKPLFNRAIKATYRPGSIWKMVQGLIALDEGRIRPGTRFPCDRELIGCHGPHTTTTCAMPWSTAATPTSTGSCSAS